MVMFFSLSKLPSNLVARSLVIKSV